MLIRTFEIDRAARRARGRRRHHGGQRAGPRVAASACTRPSHWLSPRAAVWSAGLDEPAPPVPTELAGHGVFESILAQHGRPLRLADHLARLARSVRELYALDLPEDLAGRVATVAATHPRRLGSRSGCTFRPSDGEPQIEVTARPLGPGSSPARSPSPSVLITAGGTSGPIDVSCRRARADRTGAALLSSTPPAGVAETSRGNLFVRGADGAWRTPPSGDHQLPGVTRRALLDELGDRGIAVQIVPIAHGDLAVGPIRGVDQQPQRGRVRRSDRRPTAGG